MPAVKRFFEGVSGGAGWGTVTVSGARVSGGLKRGENGALKRLSLPTAWR